VHFSALLLILVAGLMMGSFVLPMKVMPHWDFENTWLLFCFMGLVILPSLVAYLTVPHLGQVLLTSPSRSLLLTTLCGLCYGCGSVLFGLGVREMGMGLTYSIVAGLSSSLGSLIPWATAHGQSMSYSLLLWLGVLVMLTGVAVCSLAGRERAKHLGTAPTAVGNQRQLYTGLAICISSGVLACFQNVGLAFGLEITQHAEKLGATVRDAPNAVWLIIMNCGFVATVLYYGRLISKKKSWKKYRVKTFPYFCLALVMALLWEGCLVGYGAGANELGRLGPSVGWPILMSISIMTSNVLGAATGEWRGAGRKAACIMVLGIGVLLSAVFILGWASTKA
jgi:L-rhamnose-H+ transport protein